MAIVLEMKVDVEVKRWRQPILWLGLAFLRVGRFLVEFAANHGHSITVDGRKNTS